MAAFGKFTLADIPVALKNIVSMLQRPLWADPSSGAVRSVTLVTTVSTLTVQQYMSAFAAPSAGYALAYDAAVINPMRISYALNVRSRIKDS
jgi:predicted anti-sigma-YlaC factor YlaD